MSYKDTVLPIVRSVRDIVLPEWGTAELVINKSDHPADAVTEVDKKVEKVLREKLAIAHPDISFVGEEDGGNREAKRFWLVDPIDGTGHYMRGLPFCTVMLALIENQRINFSVVYDFVSDTMYYATRGEGCFANETRLGVSNRKLSDAYIILESNIVKSENKLLHDKLFARTGILIAMTAGWSLAMVAAGKLDGRVTVDGWGFDYDFAAGSLLVEEAGGIVANIGSQTYDYRDRDFLACNEEVFRELTEGPEAIFPIEQQGL